MHFIPVIPASQRIEHMTWIQNYHSLHSQVAETVNNIKETLRKQLMYKSQQKEVRIKILFLFREKE